MLGVTAKELYWSYATSWADKIGHTPVVAGTDSISKQFSGFVESLKRFTVITVITVSWR